MITNSFCDSCAAAMVNDDFTEICATEHGCTADNEEHGESCSSLRAVIEMGLWVLLKPDTESGYYRCFGCGMDALGGSVMEFVG